MVNLQASTMYKQRRGRENYYLILRKFMDTSPSESEKDRMFSVNDNGHDYELHNMENGVQNIKFINKKADSDGKLTTVHDGTTNEAVLQVLIDRLEWLNGLMHSDYNINALSHLKEALHQLEARTADRKAKGIEGTANVS